MTVQFSTPNTVAERHNTQHHRQTDRQTDGLTDLYDIIMPTADHTARSTIG